MSGLQRPFRRLHYAATKHERRPKTWLAQETPPGLSDLAGEKLLWWAVVQRSARDLLSSRNYLAGDALEFLAATGVWLCRKLFDIDETQTADEITRLLGWRLANHPTRDLVSMCADGKFRSAPTTIAPS